MTSTSKFSSSLPAFNPETNDWAAYMGRFELHLAGNGQQGIPGDQKKALFLANCGDEVYHVARSLVAPASIEDTPWADIQRLLAGQYGISEGFLVARNRFYNRRQRAGEPIRKYLGELRSIAARCEFVALENMLRDRLVMGMRDEHVKKRLIVRRSLTLSETLDEALAAEESESTATEMRRGDIHRTHREPTPDPEATESDEAGEEETVHRTFTSRKQRAWRDERDDLECPGCLGNHTRANCRFLDTTCSRCLRRGHIAKACRASRPNSRKQRSPPRRHTSPPRRSPPRRSPPRKPRENKWKGSARPDGKRDQRRGYDDDQDERKVHHMVVSHTNSTGAEKFFATVMIGKQPCKMEVDTGSICSIMSWDKLKRLLPELSHTALEKPTGRLVDFNGHNLRVLGRARVDVSFRGHKARLPLTVVEGHRPTLLGVEWLKPLGLGFTGLHRIHKEEFEQLLEEFPDVFDGSLGKYRGKPISLNLDPSVAPIRLKPRRVPFALRHKVDEQLDKLLAQGVIEPVDHAKWETPIVLPLKPDGSLRVCADYKGTINKALQPHAYPVPVVQHLLHSLGDGNVFAKLDLAQAYQQLPVDEATAEAQTIVTHRGAFKCNRLQFGVSVAPGLFQSVMERLLQGIPGVVPYFDDVLISATSRDQLKDRLRQVLSRFQARGLKVKRDKCKLGVPRVEFLGFLIDGQGIHPTDEKIKAIKQAPTPKNKTDLQAFLGLLNFYAVFLKQKATVAEPLHRLLGKATTWTWGQREARAFAAVKDLLTSSSVLIQHSDTLPLQLTCDASPFGIGAVLSHVLPNGREAPIAYYSKTMSPAERNYSQLDKEALAIVASTKRFHEYLYGRHFRVITDHKPLLGLLAGDKQTPQFLSPRLIRWSIFLAGYDYELIHKPGASISHADALSRCPTPGHIADPAPFATVLLVDVDSSSPVTSRDVAEHTKKDKLLGRVLNWVLRGWPQEAEGEDSKPFFAKRTELSVCKGCVLWGERVVIPQALRKKVINTLHVGHPGIVRMKALARSYLWWPQLDKDIQEWVATCEPCQESRSAPPKATPLEWEIPRAPWSRLHVDFAGPVEGRSYLITVDAYSKWLEVIPMPSTTTSATIKALDGLFATHGLPDVLVSDNGPQLTAKDMEEFLANLGIRHTLIAPYSPQSNGRAERMVRLTKEALTRMGASARRETLEQFLLAQHNTPCAATGRSPAEMLMGRRLRSPLDRLHPSYQTDTPPESRKVTRGFTEGDLVYALNHAGEPKWVKATIISIAGPRSYEVRVEDNRVWRRHLDQLRGRIGVAGLRQESVADNTSGARDNGGDEYWPLVPPVSQPPREARPIAAAQGQPRRGKSTEARAEPSHTVPRRSTRGHRPPTYLKDYVTTIHQGR